MKNFKEILLILAGMFLTAHAPAQNARIICVPKAGTLNELITSEEAKQITHLTLQGRLNAVDFRHLRDSFNNLQVLDISPATISRYAGKRGTRSEQFHIYPANCIPAYAFCKKTEDSTFVGQHTLAHVILPNKTKSIEDAAFKGCTQLKICQIRKKNAPDLMPQALVDSATAIFVPTGSSDTYRSKEEWKGFAIIEGEPITVNIRIKRMGSLSSELLRLGVQPRDINFLTVEGKLDEADFILIRNYMPNLVSINMAQTNATTIPEYTFTQKKYLLKVVLPKGLKSIGQRAFSGCGRLCGTLVLPPTVTAIEYGAFMGCERLSQVVATGNKITTLGDNLFGDTSGKLVYSQP